VAPEREELRTVSCIVVENSISTMGDWGELRAWRIA
jgi:hypothetical protein